MFTSRLTETWDASEEVSTRFLLERRLDLASSPDPVFLARERETGIQRWVKCLSGDDESVDRFTTESTILSTLVHHCLLRLYDSCEEPSARYLVYEWCAEEPLSLEILEALSTPDRCRLAIALIDVLGYLQEQDEPIAHRQLALDWLWVTPTVRHLHLAGLSNAVTGASSDELAVDRHEAVELVSMLLAGTCDQESLVTGIKEMGEKWEAQGGSTLVEYRHALKRVFIAQIAADLP